MKKFYFIAIMMLAFGFAKAQCTQLFISEYVEDTAFNKALEIYNPTANTINLQNYRLQLYTNGNTTPNRTIGFGNKTIAPGDVFVIAHPQANIAGILAAADTLSDVTNFNGNDAVVLSDGTHQLDVIGVIGTDSVWVVDTGSLTNHILVRKAAVNTGNTSSWATSSTTEWNALGLGAQQLGAHTMTACTPGADLVNASPVTASTSENTATYTLYLNLTNATHANAFSVDVALTGGSGTAADINNYTTQTANFAANVGVASVPITITNDATTEANETFIFTLSNPTGGLALGSDATFTLTITANDQPYPVYTIAQVSGINATTGALDSTGIKCELTGTVHGIDYRAAGYQFFLHDGTGGIGVFRPTDTLGFSVVEGQVVSVQGELTSFNGFAQLQFVNNFTVVGTGTVNTPTVVQQLDETTESELVRINNVYLTDATQWDNSVSSGFTVTITDGQNNYDLRIDEQTTLFNQAAPTSSFDVIGMGSQFDNSSPYTSGYQIQPRYAADIILHTGINDVAADNSIVVFPNPSKGTFTVSFNKAIDNATVRVYDLAGRMVYNTTNTAAAEFMTVNTNNLTAGTYIVEITDGTFNAHKKISIQ
jgi:hypothetical protein